MAIPERPLAIIRRAPLVESPTPIILPDLFVWESLEYIAEVANLSLKRKASSSETIDVTPARYALALKNLANLTSEHQGWIVVEGRPYKSDESSETYSMWFNGSAGKKCLLAVHVEPRLDLKTNKYWGKITLAKCAGDGVSVAAKIYQTYAEEETIIYLCNFIHARSETFMLTASSTRDGALIVGPAFSIFKALLYPNSKTTMV